MDISIKINTNNEAFTECTGSEVARILKDLAADLDERDLLPDTDNRSLRDINGNKVGFMMIIP